MDGLPFANTGSSEVTSSTIKIQTVVSKAEPLETDHFKGLRHMSAMSTRGSVNLVHVAGPGIGGHPPKAGRKQKASGDTACRRSFDQYRGYRGHP